MVHIPFFLEEKDFCAGKFPSNKPATNSLPYMALDEQNKATAKGEHTNYLLRCRTILHPHEKQKTQHWNVDLLLRVLNKLESQSRDVRSGG